MGVLIIGGGHGGYQTAFALRAEGYGGSITIVGEEPHLPYQRPPLSKGLLLGKQQERHAFLRPAEFYTKQNIEVITGVRVKSLREAPVPYDWCVLATGSRNRLLTCGGAENVLYLRTLDESLAVKQRMETASSVAVIGGGFVGLEIAAAARVLGKEATVIEAQPRLMARVVAPVVSQYFLEQHRARGVRVLLNSFVECVEPGAVVLRDGSRVEADLIIAGIGIVPNDELAREAGLAVGNGIVVDEYLRTSDPKIFAIGDCAEYPSAFTEGHVRLESVQNAVDQAACVAKAICGKPAPYAAVPWFWSDQFDIHLQTTGLSHGCDQTVLRGSTEANKFSVFYYRGGILRAVDTINNAAEHMTARKLIGAHFTVTPEQAADEAFDLKSALQ